MATTSYLVAGMGDSVNNRVNFTSYIYNDKPEILVDLCMNYHKDGEVAFVATNIIRELIKTDGMAACILYSEPDGEGGVKPMSTINPRTPVSGDGVFWSFFPWINDSNFGKATSAFDVFKDLLLLHPGLSAHFIVVNQDRFVDYYHRWLSQSASYVVRRQSTKVLNTMLMDRPFYHFMFSYIKDWLNLRQMMILLSDPSGRMINYEAWHCFKIFVVDPEQNAYVKKILIKNRTKLMGYLKDFHSDRFPPVCQFTEERAAAIASLRNLPTLQQWHDLMRAGELNTRPPASYRGLDDAPAAEN